MYQQDLLILFLLIMFMVSMVTSHCFHGNAEPTCQFTCHCSDDVPCDYINGTCPENACDESPIITDWFGAACQLGNVAVGGTVSSSGDNPDVAAYCIDDDTTGEVCNLDPTEEAYWQVDLDDDYAIDNVDVFHPTDTDVMYITLLDKHGNEVDKQQKWGKTFFYYKVARTVRITSGQTESIQMYEVRVLGYKYRECVQQADGRFYYGLGCQLPCAEGCAEQCDMITGDGCTVCRPGYQGYECLEKCRQGYWGDNCMFYCHCPDQSIDCDHVTGECPN